MTTRSCQIDLPEVISNQTLSLLSTSGNVLTLPLPWCNGEPRLDLVLTFPKINVQLELEVTEDFIFSLNFWFSLIFIE